jgi:hypothetical protein
MRGQLRRRYPHVLAALVAISWIAGSAPVLAAGPRHDASALSRARPGSVTSVRIYLVAIGAAHGAGIHIGCGDSLVALTHPVPTTTAPMSAALRLLLRDHRPYYGQSGLYNALYQSRLSLQSARVSAGRAVIRLTGSLRLGGVCDDPRVRAQLRHTALQFPTVRTVQIYVNNVPLSRVLSEKG